MPITHLLALPLLASLATADHTRVSDVVYGKKLGVALTMDVFKPERPNGIGALFMVSGGWVSRHEAITPEVARPLTDKGITVFMVVHGSQPKFTLPEIVSDVNRAVRFVRTNAADYKVDPSRLGVFGMSAGGHLSLMLGAFGKPGNAEATDPVERASSEVQSVAAFFPPTDMLNYGKPGQEAFEIPALRVFWPAFGMTPQTPKEKAREMATSYSPIVGVTAKMPPVLLIHGDADTLVPIQQSEIIAAKLKESGVKHRLEVRPGKGHGWAEMRPDLNLVADWFLETLGKK